MKLNKILKYLVYSIITVLLLEYIPQKKLPDSDIIFMISTLILSSIILDIISDEKYFEYFDKNLSNKTTSKKVKSKKTDSKKTDSKKTDSKKTDSEEDDSEEADSEEDDSEEIDSEEIDSEEVDSEEVDSEEVDSEEIDSEEIDSEEIDSEEVQINDSKILKILKNKLLDNEIELLEKNCIDEKKCLNIIDQFLNNKKIDNNEMILLKINYGITPLKNLQSFYQQDRLEDKVLIEISNMIDTKSILLVNEILDYYMSKNLISSSDKSNIMKNLDLNEDHNLARSYLVNSFTKINNNDISKIDVECSSDSIDRCSILLNNLKNKNSITEEMYNEILKLYNKPGFIDTTFENNKYAKLDNKKLDKNNVKSVQTNNKTNKKINLKINKSNKYDEESDMNYNIYKDINPLGKYTDDFNNKFVNGNDYLNTDKWRVPVYEPPLCKLDECQECNDENDYPLNVSQWNDSRKILQRDNINIDYINDNLNS